MKIKQYHFATFLLFLFLFCFSFLKAQQTEKQQEKKDTTAISLTVANDDENKIYNKPEIKAKVDSIVWRTHLGKQLGLFLRQPSSVNIPPGKYTVKVQFIVERDGSLSEVKALEDPGYGLAEAAINVVKTGPKWIAAEQGGKKVRSYRIQPISFFFQNKNHST